MGSEIWHITRLRKEDWVGKLAINQILPIGCYESIVDKEIGD